MLEAGSPSTEAALEGPDAHEAPEAWAARLRSRPEAARHELLARADAAWLEGPDRRRRVCDVYRVLHADLDPATREGCMRVRRLLDEGGVMRLEALMARAEATAADPETRHMASLVLGQWDLVRGDFARCERRYLDAIEAGRGRWPALLGAAYNNYARLCLEHRRDLEALVLARRGSEACAAVDDALGAVYGRLVEGFVLSGLEDWARLRDVCRWLRRELPSVTSPSAGGIEYGLHELLAYLAVGERRPADAFDEIRRAEELARAQHEPSWCHREVDVVATQAWSAMGRRDEALEALTRGLAAGDPDDAQGFLLQAWRVRVHAELGSPETAAHAASWLDALESPAGLALGAGVRVVHAQLGADALARGGRWPDEARRAYRVAAGAALRRLAEVARFTREFPDVSRPTPTEAQVLDDYRRRTEAREADLRAAVSHLLVEEARAGRWPLESLAGVGGFVCCCAWCAAVRSLDGHWAPLPESLRTLPGDTVPLTHGVCPDCLPALRASLREI